MKKRKIFIVVLILAAVTAGIYFATMRQPGEIILTGIVTTDEVIVSPEIQGRLQNLFIREGDAVTNGQLLAEIQPQTQQADVAILRQQRTTSRCIGRAGQGRFGKCPAEFRAHRKSYIPTTRNPRRLTTPRGQLMNPPRRASNRSTNKHKPRTRKKKKPPCNLSYTKILAPTNGIVDTRAALQGEVVNPGQAIVTLINQDDLWVRADVEETYIDRIHLGDKLPVRLPSGATREGHGFLSRRGRRLRDAARREPHQARHQNF